MSVVQVLDHAVELEPANAEIRCKRGTFHLSMIANNTPPRPLPRNEHCLAGVADFAEASGFFPGAATAASSSGAKEGTPTI